MTTNQSLYKAVLDILRKDIRGEAVSVAEFNAILPVVSHEYFIQQYAKFQQTQKITDSLAPFIKTATITLTSGVGYLPYDYMHLIGTPTYSQTVGSATYTREIDVVSLLEKDDRATDPITQPTAVYPTAVLGTAAKTGYIGSYIAGGYETELNSFAMSVVNGVTYPAIAFNSEENYLNDGDYITLSGGRTAVGVLSSGYNGTHRAVRVTGGVRLPDLTYDGDVSFALYSIAGRKTITVYPTTITSISITYLCRPVTPKLDYYVTDATNVRTFLSVSATHVADTDAESFPVADSAPGDGDTYTSETVEMEWMPQDRPSILAMIMQKIGVPLGDQMLTSFGMATVQNNDK
jgi:hypothetical protein